MGEFLVSRKRREALPLPAEGILEETKTNQIRRAKAFDSELAGAESWPPSSMFG
jgi:hypothetical protein